MVQLECVSVWYLKKGHVPSQLLVLSDTYLNVTKTDAKQSVAEIEANWFAFIEERRRSQLCNGNGTFQILSRDSVPSKYQYCKNYHFISAPWFRKRIEQGVSMICSKCNDCKL